MCWCDKVVSPLSGVSAALILHLLTRVEIFQSVSPVNPIIVLLIKKHCHTYRSLTYLSVLMHQYKLNVPFALEVFITTTVIFIITFLE